MWFGLLGGPLAWAVAHVLGFGVTQAACDPAGKVLHPSIDGWTIAVTATAALVTLLAGLASLATFRATRDADADSPPPGGRIYFMSLLGLTITPLFFAIIAMDALGVLVLDRCVQA
jgi:hypothetical protein